MKSKKLLKVIFILSMTLVLLAGAVGGWFLYDNYVDRSGWVLQHEQYYYRDFHNHNVTGWQDIDGHRYYFDETGVMQTGWLPLEEQLYYLDTDGTMVTGWLRHHGHDYYLEQDGAVHTGLLELECQLFLLDADGARLTGMHTVGDNTYYFTPEGPAHQGPLELEGNQYFFDDDFTRHSGWREDGDRKFYYDADGILLKDLQEIDGKVYFFGEDGNTHHGWLEQGEYHYYFGDDGAALTGPQEIDGVTYHFTPKGIHVVLVNASNPIPSYYKPEIVTLFDWYQVAKPCLEPMKKMLHDCEAAGISYTFNSSYRSHKNQQDIVELRTQEYINQGMNPTAAYLKTLETAAVPGTSEHEMGLAADIVGKEANEWLAEHCWEYGFILRYPPDKGDITGITYEPWHFRYVGTEVSMDMKDSGLCLEEYLGAGPVKK